MQNTIDIQNAYPSIPRFSNGFFGFGGAGIGGRVFAQSMHEHALVWFRYWAKT